MLLKTFTLANLALLAAGGIAADSSASVQDQLESSKLSFGKHYAVLNLDLMEAIVAPIANTTEGKKFISNTATWINTVHKQHPPPLSIFTRVYFSNSQRPELAPDIPFYQVANSFGNITETSPETQIYPAFKPLKNWDVELRKSRYYAGDGNSLEEILRVQKIDTVILSGLRTSGVILSTAYRLYDLDYNIYVISNNTIEPKAAATNDVILTQILPKLPVNVITIDQAIKALRNSGPAHY